MRKFLSLFTMLMLVVMLGIAQTRQIAGRVLDESGQPVSGASVLIKGTNTGASANASGDFTINAKTGDVLVISAVGIPSKEVRVPAGSSISVSLTRQSENLSEVVVTALGIRRTRNQVPYAAQTVTGEDVSKTRTSNFVQNLSGKVSGLEIRQPNTMGGSTNVLLRGSKSLTGSNQALFVVDGVPFDNGNNNTLDQTTGRGGYDYGNAAADINPDDIDNITVLKGAAASALYGSRGSNGVILITTKKGKRGLGIIINSGVTVNSILRNTFPKYQKKYGAGYGSYFDEADVNGDGVPDKIAPTYDDASWGTAFNPNLMVYQWHSFDPTSPNYKKATPWVAAANDPSTFFIKPVSLNNSVFLQSGNDRSTFALGYTRNNEKGVLPNSSINKDLLNVSATYNITDNLTAGGSANYSRINGLGRFGTGYDGANALNLMTNFRQWWEVNVDLKELKDAYFRNRQNVTWNQHYGPSGELQPEFWDNPYFTRYESYESDSRDRYFGNVYLNYKPVSWLNILGRVSLDSYSELEQERKAVTSVGVPFYRRYNQNYNEINYDLIANADWNITSDINIKALLGSNTRTQYRSNIDANTNGGLGVPKLYTIANSINAPAPPLEFEGRKRVEGVFAGGTFSYKNTYTLDATIRRDRSSTLPEANNVYYYPSVSAGFVFSQLIKPTWLSYGKLRANYAEVGGDAPLYTVNDYYVSDIDDNSGQEVTSFNGNALFSVNGYKNNPNLKPERTKSFEVGLEMAFFKTRLGFDATYYKAQTVDQILPLTVSTATGYSRKYVNSGTVQNKGFELSVYGTPIKTPDFSWDININWTRNRSKVTKLYGDIDNIVLGSFQGSITLNASLNEPYGTIHGTDYIYTNGQKTVDENGNYMITPTNNITIGNVNPDWIGGVSNRFTYRGVSLSGLIDVRQGGSVFSTDMYYALAGGLYEETAVNNDLGNPIRSPLTNDSKSGGIIRQGVTADGKPNTIRASIEDYGSFDSYVSSPDKRFAYDASYVKLRELSLGYSLPAKMFRNKFFKGIDVALVGRNLAILHKNLPYADPEDSFGAGNLQGIQIGSYPAVRSFGFNVKIKL
ncbi:SusC/RagA family TonB-linked outer membrane protein [Segetibacter koreensis]|uniref:SusC/RagA family TonB-linked outer membrane protein n=1 Tax=Segetibacter koreensis TaxID=398037 RepID=UPI000368C936|nr:SusC/RagA family TonB-linked outer membrane protein [Segetibacter koreensis]